MSELAKRHCQPCSGTTPKVAPETMRLLVADVAGWSLVDNDTVLTRQFEFGNFYQTMAFVNAVAWIAHREDHHPDLQVSYRSCNVRYTTHAIRALSENDFICAAKINRLLDD